MCDDYRALAAKVPAWDAFYGRLPALATADGVTIREVYSEADNLEAVFKYLVSQ